MNQLPLQPNRIDHYTIIVPNGREVSEFHQHVLGYPFLELKNINTGTAAEGAYDMANYIMEWPDQSGRILVITEGLTEASIFHRFMHKYGQGIHHIALEIDDVEAAFEALRENNVRLTSPRVVTDMLSGLKQCFIDNADTGVFIELIERRKAAHAAVDASQKGFFTRDNMTGLAGTMQDYLDEAGPDHAVREQAAESIRAYDDRQLKNLQLTTFVVEVADVAKAVHFYTHVLGFARTVNGEGVTELYLPQEPGIRFRVSALDREGFNCKLLCTTPSVAAARDVLTGYRLIGANAGESIHLDKGQSGYDLILSASATLHAV